MKTTKLSSTALFVLYSHNSRKHAYETLILFCYNQNKQWVLLDLEKDVKKPQLFTSMTELNEVVRELCDELNLSRAYLLSAYEYKEALEHVTHVDQLPAVFWKLGQVMDNTKQRERRRPLLGRFFRD